MHTAFGVPLALPQDGGLNSGPPKNTSTRDVRICPCVEKASLQMGFNEVTLDSGGPAMISVPIRKIEDTHRYGQDISDYSH